jgi:AcrR family transcriptional regulator
MSDKPVPNLFHSEKASQILDIAQARFGLYGLEKTTMREIAEDLNMTKGSLYYYYPDKEQLYIAVIDKEQKQFIRSLESAISPGSSPEEVLRGYVEARIRYFRSLLNLSRLRIDLYRGLKPALQEKWICFNEQEVGLISKILSQGMEEGVFHMENPESTARLYLDLLRGLRQTVLIRKETLYIDEEEFKSLVDKAKSFTDMFIRSLKYNK